MAEKIILGIDPGTNVMGYGLIKVLNKKAELIAMGVIDLKKYKDPYLKLQNIYKRIAGLVKEYKPDEMALEAPFFGKNVQSMLKLGRAQGVAMAAGLAFDIPISEYLPRKVKQAITGNGNASKEQVAGFLQNVLKLKSMPAQLDATDGLAVAMCHFYQSSVTAAPKAYNSWKDFINKNPKRVN